MVDISKALQNIKYELKAILFDWGDTVMKIFPDQKGPMANWRKIAPVSGIENVLSALYQKYQLVLITNARDSDCDLVRRALEKINLAAYFTKIFTPHELKSRKPAPDFFLNALQIIEIDPHNAIMIGDDYENDIIGAKQVGMWTVWFNAQQKQVRHVFPYHDFEVQKLQEIPAILERKFRGIQLPRF